MIYGPGFELEEARGGEEEEKEEKEAAWEATNRADEPDLAIQADFCHPTGEQNRCSQREKQISRASGGRPFARQSCFESSPVQSERR